MISKFDEESYQRGRKGFQEGTTLRDLVERGAAAKTDDDEAKVICEALGLFDGFIDWCRNFGSFN